MSESRDGGNPAVFAFEGLLNHVSDAVVLTNQHGVITYCNPSGCSLFGYAPGELVGRPLTDLFVNGTPPLHREPPESVQANACRKDGSTFLATVTAHACFDGQSQVIIREAEGDLWEREALYRAVIEDQTELIRRFRPDGILTFVNPAFCRYFARTKAELLGRSFITLFPPEDHEQVWQSIAELTPEQPVGTAVRRFIDPSGEVHWQQWVNHASFDPAGSLVEIQSVGRDITQQRELEQELKDSAARYRAVVEDQTELIRRFRPDGTLTFVNSAFCRYFGRTEEELLGMKFITLFPPEDHQHVWQSIAALTPEDPVGTAERRFIRPDGEIRWQQWVNRAIFDAQGRLVEVQSVGRDITRRRRMEEQLRESEARYRAVVDDQTDVIRRFRPDGTLTFVNQAFCRFYGKSEADLLGQNYIELVHPEDREMVLQRMAGLSPENPCTITEPRIVRPSGEIGWLQYANRGIFDSHGRLVECQSVGRDITAQKEAELRIVEAREATNRAARVTTLAIIGGSIAHEINQPLNAIRVLAETVLYLYEVKGTPSAEDVISSLRNISRQVDRIDNIVNHLRSVLKNNQNREYSLCDLNDVIEKALSLVENRIRSHQIRLRKVEEEGLPPVYGCFVSFEEVVLNLLVNAMQALDSVRREDKEITIRTWADDRVHLEVSDNGPGIDPALRDRMLEPFYTTKSGDSMGLGLSIVQSIITASNGQIVLDNNVGGGAVVRISFPIATQS